MKTAFDYFGITMVDELPSSDRFQELPHQIKRCNAYTFEPNGIVRFYDFNNKQFYDIDCSTGFLHAHRIIYQIPQNKRLAYSPK